MNKNTYQKRSKLTPFIALVILVAVIGGGIYFIKKDHRNSETTPQVANGINYAPPTDEEKQQAEDNKKVLEQRIETEKEAADNPNTTARAVQPLIAYADQADNIIEVSSFVPNLIEDGGTCTLQLKQGTQTITKTVTGLKDATTTRCPLFSVNRSELTQAGTWTATVTYQSSTAQGSSQSKELAVK